MMALATGLVGIAMLILFLGILAWWIKALPFVIIVTVVVLLVLYDFVRTLRYGDSGPRP